jgi:hypothetical protein
MTFNGTPAGHFLNRDFTDMRHPQRLGPGEAGVLTRHGMIRSLSDS